MSLAKYEIFSKVVELGSLTKAGEKMNLTQSAVSHAINSLESEFGFSLLNRGRTGLSLTVNGERILEYIREILQVNERMIQEAAAVKGLEIGTVRIGTFTSVSSQWLPGIFKEFKSAYPGITIELYEGDYEEIENWIVSGEIDCGFVSKMKTDILEVISLRTEKLLCIIPTDHPLVNQDKILFKQIEQEPFIMPRYGGYHDVKRFFKENDVKVDAIYELVDDYAIISMVENHLGISVLPQMLLSNLPEGVSCLDLEMDCHRTIGIAANYNMSPATRSFIDGVVDWIRRN
ncbi:LysR family transcriptional regulator [Halalkalibacter akibai]|uniref:LysR family transcriptional regulator STM2281 n=1 Tax=Halalkalibacter akibai (strain ATCC 43226 / DSM 21942 / CIP 109018 / JCM 9157 / 1139) TaxID=1236973 RepID=W4QPI0_HALA3|nr:LysR family transcriptional regulator [Halalkalibacter akibai]GAE34010.1 LysR family transcriptional regulator STM2281 [Halalkalibacter akibai JCM 9157]